MKPEKMIRSIVWWMFVGVIVLFIFVWFLSGGPRAVFEKTSSWLDFGTAVENKQSDTVAGGVFSIFTQRSSGEWFQLPWQPQLPQGVIVADPDSYLSSDDRESYVPEVPAARIERLIYDSNPDREFIEFSFTRSTNLSGMKVQSAAGASFPFPLAISDIHHLGSQAQEMVVVQPGETVLLITGAPPGGSSYYENGVWHLFIGSPTPLWTHDHDTISLIDASGRIVDSFTY